MGKKVPIAERIKRVEAELEHEKRKMHFLGKSADRAHQLQEWFDETVVTPHDYLRAYELRKFAMSGGWHGCRPKGAAEMNYVVSMIYHFRLGVRCEARCAKLRKQCDLVNELANKLAKLKNELAKEQIADDPVAMLRLAMRAYAKNESLRDMLGIGHNRRRKFDEVDELRGQAADLVNNIRADRAEMKRPTDPLAVAARKHYRLIRLQKIRLQTAQELINEVCRVFYGTINVHTPMMGIDVRFDDPIDAVIARIRHDVRTNVMIIPDSDKQRITWEQSDGIRLPWSSTYTPSVSVVLGNRGLGFGLATVTIKVRFNWCETHKSSVYPPMFDPGEGGIMYDMNELINLVRKNDRARMP